MNSIRRPHSTLRVALTKLATGTGTGNGKFNVASVISRTSKRLMSNAAPKAKAEASKAKENVKKVGIWKSPEVWGGLGALAGWGMSGAAIYDAYFQGAFLRSFVRCARDFLSVNAHANVNANQSISPKDKEKETLERSKSTQTRNMKCEMRIAENLKLQSKPQ